MGIGFRVSEYSSTCLTIEPDEAETLTKSRKIVSLGLRFRKDHYKDGNIDNSNTTNRKHNMLSLGGVQPMYFSGCSCPLLASNKFLMWFCTITLQLPCFRASSIGTKAEGVVAMRI